MKELLAVKKLNLFYCGANLGQVLAHRGFRQGSPEASFLFALIVCHLLGLLDESWKKRGIGIKLRSWGGSSTAFSDWWREHCFIFRGVDNCDLQDLYLTSLGFLDDIYFVCSSLAQAQQMLSEASTLFTQVGLKLNLSKIHWMRNKHCDPLEGSFLKLGNVWIPSSDSLVVLGSVVCIDGSEKEAVRHRIGKAWGVFHKWEHILTSGAPLDARLSFWARVVGPSLGWGLQTLRQPLLVTQSTLGACQNLMIRKMMRIKRQKQGDILEPWLLWQQRSLSQARSAAVRTGIEVLSNLEDTRSNWAGHLIRLGSATGERHMCKQLLCWRPLCWWRHQQIMNLISHDTIFHPFGWGKPRRWEQSLHESWMLQGFHHGKCHRFL